MEGHFARARALEVANSELAVKVDSLTSGKTAAENQLAVLDDHLRTAQAELKDKTALSRAAEADRIAALARADGAAEENARLARRLNQAEQANTALAEERRSLRERLMLEAEEHLKLSKAHEELSAGSSQRKRELLETTSELDKARKLNSDIETRLTQSLGEADQLRHDLHASQTAHQEEAYTLNLQLDALKSRVRLTEQLLTAAREEARRLTDGQNALEQTRRLLARSESAFEEAKQQVEEKTKHILELERSREQIEERATELDTRLREKQALNDQAADRIRALQEGMTALDAKKAGENQQLVAQIAKLTEQLEKERTERAYVEGALQIARRDRTQLQGLLAQNRAALSRQAPLAVVEADRDAQKDSDDFESRLREAAANNVEPIPPNAASL
ncbi:MAG: hypothetical protein KGM42_14380 [Hyphomicrobiales bacterium]|nr:hypothetical protein [Hyphomicrobiales bacterium]